MIRNSELELARWLVENCDPSDEVQALAKTLEELGVKIKAPVAFEFVDLHKIGSKPLQGKETASEGNLRATGEDEE